MKNDDFKSLWHILYQLREYYPLILIYSVCISVLTLATPISVQSLVSTFAFGPYFQPIFVLSIILLALLFILGVIKSLQYLVVEYLQRKLFAKVSLNIGRAYYLRQDGVKYDIDKKANRFFDVVLIHKKVAFLVTDGIALTLQTTLGLVLICFYHPFFIILSVIIFIAILVPVYALGGRATRSAVDESNAKYEVADYFEEISLEGCGSDSKEISRANNRIQNYIDKRAYHFRAVFFQNIAYVAMYAGLNALLLALGGYLVIKNQLSIGQLVAAEIIVNAILSNFLYANKFLESFYDLYGAIKKVEIFYHFIDDVKKDNEVSDSELLNDEAYTAHYCVLNNIYKPRNYKNIVIKFFVCSITMFGLLFITPWQQFSRSQGKIVAFNPNDRVQKITATVSGVVEEWLIRDGQFVKKGEPLVRIVDNDPDYLMRLESRRDAAVAKFEAAREASDTARLNFRRQRRLVEEGLSSQKEYEQSKIKYKKLQSEEASAAASLAKAEVAFSRQQQQELVAPRDGMVLRILKGSGTTNVKKGDDLIDFVPTSNDNAVELFVDANDMPLIYEGRKVRLQFEGWPAIQFTGWPSVAVGSFGGIVSTIDPSVSEDGTFRILVKPDHEDENNWPDQKFLRQGTRAIGIVLLDEVSLGFEFWRQVNGFPKSMESVPDVKKKDKKK